MGVTNAPEDQMENPSVLSYVEADSAWSGIARFALSLVLSGTSGIRATMPLFLVSLMHITSGFPLSQQAQWVGHPATCMFMGVLVVVEVIADLIPAVDHMLDGLMTFLRPLFGVLAAIAPQTPGGAFSAVPLAAVGAGLAFCLHILKASMRLVSSVTTAGCCNPFLSLLETLLAAAAVLACVFVAVLAVIAAVAVLLLAALSLKVQCRPRSENKEAEGTQAETVVQEVPAVHVGTMAHAV